MLHTHTIPPRLVCGTIAYCRNAEIPPAQKTERHFEDSLSNGSFPPGEQETSWQSRSSARHFHLAGAPFKISSQSPHLIAKDATSLRERTPINPFSARGRVKVASSCPGVATGAERAPSRQGSRSPFSPLTGKARTTSPANFSFRNCLKFLLHRWRGFLHSYIQWLTVRLDISGHWGRPLLCGPGFLIFLWGVCPYPNSHLHFPVSTSDVRAQ